MVHDWEYERRSAEGDAFDAWCEANDEDPSDAGAFARFEAHVEDARAAWAEDRAEAAREDALCPW